MGCNFVTTPKLREPTNGGHTCNSFINQSKHVIDSTVQYSMKEHTVHTYNNIVLILHNTFTFSI